MKYIRLFIQLSRPLYLALAILLYLLGISIAHYLSGMIDWMAFTYGLLWTVLIYLGFQYLTEYFDPALLTLNPTLKHTPFSGVTSAIGAGKLSRPVALWAGLICLGIAASLTVSMIQFIGLNSTTAMILVILFMGELFLALPPFRLVSSGYGEVVMSILIVGLVPALAFVLQGHDFHRILFMVAFPLTTLHIGMLLALELPDYASDMSQGKKPILVRIGWQRGMMLHNLLILVSFVILGIAFVLGLPLNVAWPVILVLPFGLFQIYLMNRIGDGVKPNWNLLVLSAISTFGLAAYILTYAFWIH
jgi:1,4-dihydroxy-2-naphthoate octaprenyltransferase